MVFNALRSFAYSSWPVGSLWHVRTLRFCADLRGAFADVFSIGMYRWRSGLSRSSFFGTDDVPCFRSISRHRFKWRKPRAAPDGRSSAELFASYIGFIRRQFLVVLSVVLLTIGLAVVYLFTTPPLYSAQAKMMIDTGKVQVFQQSILGDDPVNAEMVDSQIEILKSENFALSIIKNLHLTQDPEFVESNRGLIGIARNIISKLFVSNENRTEIRI